MSLVLMVPHHSLLVSVEVCLVSSLELALIAKVYGSSSAAFTLYYYSYPRRLETYATPVTTIMNLDILLF